MNVIAIAQEFGEKPSMVMGDLDEYTAFCFDEACSYIISMIRGNGKKDSGQMPVFREHARSFHEFYAQF